MTSRKPIIAVTGLGRSGTSLMMRMLDAGGIPVYAEEKVTYEFAHCERPERIIGECFGAVKLMDPVRWRPPKTERGHTIKYLFIWMQRDYKQQAQSYAKTQRQLHALTPSREHVRAYMKMFKKETAQAMHLLMHQYPGSRLLTVSFEALLKNPLEESRRIMGYLQPDFQPRATQMAKVVIKRDPKCLEGFLEERYMQ